MPLSRSVSLDVAAYQTVHDAPGGVAGVAVLTGINANTLQHKVDVRDARYHLSLEEAARIAECTGDMRILRAFAARLRHLVLPLPAPSAEGDQVSLRIVKIAGEVGEYLKAVSTAVADERVTANELAAIVREEGDVMGAIAELHGLLEAMTGRGQGGD